MAQFRLALISMPWPLANRPSIQLSALKSFLKVNVPGIRVDCYHLYLDIANLLGLQKYNALAERTWVAESIYAYLSYSDKRPEIAELFHREHKGKKPPVDLETLSARINRFHLRRHLELPWSSYNLIGFSISLSQLTSSLYMLREIRQRHPSSLIVAGGSSCAGELGSSLLANIPEIDFVITGEGELPLLHLVRRLRQGDFETEPSAGLLWRDARGEVTGGSVDQLPDLGKLPIPDYTDYFDQLHQQSSLGNLIPGLPVETSRGCWWHRGNSVAKRACRFCNLNLQWRGYRSKATEQTVNEMKELVKKHSSLKFFLVDNILDPATVDDLFDAIFQLGRSLEIFAEIRASTSRQQLLRMRRAGVTRVQIGVEALSSKLLRKINKGTTAIQNIEVMRNCEEFGIQHHSNLMLGFPRSDSEDVQETLTNIEFVKAYQPLRLVWFWLGHGSAIARYPKNYGIRRIANHPNYSRLLPDSLASSLSLMIKTYVGDRTRQQSLWRPVVREVKKWQQQYQKRHSKHSPAPLLGYRDGGDFLLVRRRSLGAEHQTFRLRGSSRAIYLFCQTRRSFAQIQQRFPRFSSEQLQTFISDMVAKRLMFQEGKRVLSLAVNEDPLSILAGNI